MLIFASPVQDKAAPRLSYPDEGWHLEEDGSLEALQVVRAYLQEKDPVCIAGKTAMQKTTGNLSFWSGPWILSGFFKHSFAIKIPAGLSCCS